MQGFPGARARPGTGRELTPAGLLSRRTAQLEEIRAGELEQRFDLTVVNDPVVDGPQSVRVRAFAVLDVDPARVTELQAAMKAATASPARAPRAPSGSRRSAAATLSASMT